MQERNHQVRNPKPCRPNNIRIALKQKKQCLRWRANKENVSFDQDVKSKISLARHAALGLHHEPATLLFLDRDGVINHDPGDYTKNLSEFTILPTVMDALKVAREAGFEVVLITNQGGLAKGLYTHEDVAEIHAFLDAECEKNGTPILDIFYSPHHPSTGRSLSRKPGSPDGGKGVRQTSARPRAFVDGRRQAARPDAASPVGVRGVLIEPNAPLLDAVLHIVNVTHAS